MKTVRGVARVAAKSPSARRLVVSVLLCSGAVLYAMRRSGTLWVLALLLGISLEEIYLMRDWMVDMVARRLGCPDVVFRRPLQQPLAALTIDDVPQLDRPSVLEDILDVLKEHKVRATLMVMSGFDLPKDQGGPDPAVRQRYKALLSRAVSEGHELGNHLQFDRPAIAMPPEEFEQAFDHCDRSGPRDPEI
ncbi:unnamed protein product, partial [Effrenium voratum]